MKVEIVDLNPDGRGRGLAGKRAVLVSQALPGEVVSVRVDRKTRGTLQGRVGRIFHAAPRASHECAHEFRCTGCHWLAMPLAQERGLKQGQVREALAVPPEFSLQWHGPRAIGGPGEPESECFSYRHYAKQVFAQRYGRVLLGSFVAASNRVVDNSGCPVLAPRLAALMDEVAEVANEHALSIHRAEDPNDGTAGQQGLRYALARLSRDTGATQLTLVSSAEAGVELKALADDLCRRLPFLSSVYGLRNSSGGGVLLAGEPFLLRGNATISDRLLGFTHELGPESFFQVNPAAAEAIGSAVVKAAAAGGASACVDAFCGVGAWSLPLSEHFSSVFAIDDSSVSVAALQRTAAAAGCHGIEARCGDAEVVLRELLAQHASIATAAGAPVLVVDPPRKGLTASFVDLVAASTISRLVYVSCSTVSLTRDVALLRRGGFVVQEAWGVDQFPRTPHVEVVATLVR